MVSNISENTQSVNFQSLQKPPKPEEMFKKMSTEAGGDGSSITKDQLQSLIKKMTDDGKDTKPLEDMLSNFDKISGDGKTITASDMKTAMEKGVMTPPPKPDNVSGRYNFQDPSTITKDQITPPIDIKI